MIENGADLLISVLERASEATKNDQSFVAVFDLDSTLFNVSHRIQAILQAVAHDQEMRKKHPEECQILESIETMDSDWGIKQTLIRSGIRSHLGFFEDVRNHWVKRFFSNHYLHVDQPYPGAVDYVKQLDQTGAKIIYLTGRDIHRMGEGTHKSLEYWGFPLDDRNEQLFMKPRQGEDDAEFKAEFLKDLSLHSDELWLFENEPVIINKVQKEVPKVHIVFMDSVHSGREEPPSDLPKLMKSFLLED